MSRRSSGLGELSRNWESAENLCVLDLGSTSPTNIRLFTGRGHRIYSEDLLTASTDPELRTKDEQGAAILDSRKFLAGTSHGTGVERTGHLQPPHPSSARRRGRQGIQHRHRTADHDLPWGVDRCDFQTERARRR